MDGPVFGLMTRKQLVTFVIVAVIAAGAGFGGWTNFLRPIRVSADGVAKDIPVQVFGLGTVEARVTSKIGFKVSGVLVDLRADVGDHVAKDAILARLDDREQRARRPAPGRRSEQAASQSGEGECQRAKAKANYANAKSGSMSVDKRWWRAITPPSRQPKPSQAVKDAAFGGCESVESDVIGGAGCHRRRQGAATAGNAPLWIFTPSRRRMTPW